jgi:hypothetical protein
MTGTFPQNLPILASITSALFRLAWNALCFAALVRLQ